MTYHKVFRVAISYEKDSWNEKEVGEADMFSAALKLADEKNIRFSRIDIDQANAGEKVLISKKERGKKTPTIR